MDRETERSILSVLQNNCACVSNASSSRSFKEEDDDEIAVMLISIADSDGPF